MSVTVFNNHTGKSIPFGSIVNFHPGSVSITAPEQIKHLRINRKAFEMYCGTKIPGTRTPIFEIVAGSIDDWIEGDDPKKKGKANKNKSSLADISQDDALGIVELMNDVASLEEIIANDTRKKVKALAQSNLDAIRE